MRLVRLTIYRFRSFKAEQTFFFPGEPGLYFMRGDNRAEPRLEANGAGKSTIWEALTWCLYGQTSRGLKAGDVCNWTAGKGTRVELAFDEGNGLSLQVVTRTWSPNTWTLQDLFGKTIDLTKGKENPLIETLKLEFTPFLSAVLMAQGQPMFLDQKPDLKAALFSDVMGLDQWLDFSAKASKRASAADMASRGHEWDLSRLRGQLDAVEGQDFGQGYELWEDHHRDSLDTLEREYDEALKKAAQLKAQRPELERELQTRLTDLEILEAEAHETLQACKRLSTSVGELRVKKAGIEADLRHYSGHQEAADKGVCPTCGQQVAKVLQPGKHAKRLAEIALQEVNTDIATAQQKHDDARNRDESAMRKVEEARDILDTANQRVRGILRDHALAEKALDGLEERAERLQAEVNPYESLQEKAINDARRLREEVSHTQRRLDDSNSSYALFSFWVRGFKEIRLQEIGEALTELEIEVNNCVAALGLLDWELSFEVDRENKAGKLKRGFNVFVRSPHNDLQVPWESWSGGEAQRLRLATNMGLANLIRNRSSSAVDVEVWDEPTEGLSKQGVSDLLEALANRARIERRQIFVVDHTAHDFGGFAGTTVVTKTEKGSVIESTWKP